MRRFGSILSGPVDTIYGIRCTASRLKIMTACTHAWWSIANFPIPLGHPVLNAHARARTCQPRTPRLFLTPVFSVTRSRLSRLQNRNRFLMHATTNRRASTVRVLEDAVGGEDSWLAAVSESSMRISAVSSSSYSAVPAMTVLTVLVVDTIEALALALETLAKCILKYTCAACGVCRNNEEKCAPVLRLLCFFDFIAKLSIDIF